MSTAIAELRIAEKAMFLQAAYEAVAGRAFRNFDAMAIAQSIGIDGDDAKRFISEMAKRGFIDDLGMDFSASMTTGGIDAVERLEILPEPPPTPAATRTIINHPSNCNINVESKMTNSTQSIKTAKEHWLATIGKAGLDIARKIFASP